MLVECLPTMHEALGSILSPIVYSQHSGGGAEVEGDPQ